MNLFLFAHQDDEYGVYALLESMLAKQQEVHVVYLTSGTPDGRPSPKRNRESLDVLGQIGVSLENVCFLGGEEGFPDAQLYRWVWPAAMAVERYLGGIRPRRIIAPAWEGGHQDHDATYMVACYLAQQYNCLAASRQFPLYQGRGLPGALWRTFAPLPANGAVESTALSWQQRFRYLRYCLCYPSQWSSWLGLFPMVMLNMVTVGRQYLQPLLLSRVAEDPHAGACLYQRRGFCSREQFVRCTRDFANRI